MMDLYSQIERSIPQKLVILLSEIVFVVLSYLILFGNLLNTIGLDFTPGDFNRRLILFVFNVLAFSRFMFTLFVFVKRRIPWDEAGAVPTAFAIYYLGFPLLGLEQTQPVGTLAVIGILLFVVGSFVNSFAEYQREVWKRNPDHRGKLYTGGLFSLSMHINFLGDVLWVSGYAFVTHNIYSALIPVYLFTFFYFYNIPKLDRHLREHYGEQFEEYRRKTKRFIPFLL